MWVWYFLLSPLETGSFLQEMRHRSVQRKNQSFWNVQVRKLCLEIYNLQIGSTIDVVWQMYWGYSLVGKMLAKHTQSLCFFSSTILTAQWHTPAISTLKRQR